MKIVFLPDGPACLNLGCGETYSTDWTNLDLVAQSGVAAHDVRRPLPFPDASFAAVYSSHLLEHLTPNDGKALVREMWRVLERRGVCRIVVPDLEAICREYLRCLEEAVDDPTPERRRRYEWMVLELIDQMVRERPGGSMVDVLERGEADEDFVKRRMGDQFSACFGDARRPAVEPGFIQQTRSALASLAAGRPDPRESGEAHKWMYDRFSLTQLLTDAGFIDARVTTFDQSAIPCWSKYNLDTSSAGDRPRKPDSLFFECRKP